MTGPARAWYAADVKRDGDSTGDERKTSEEDQTPLLFGAVRAGRPAPLSLWEKIMKAQRLLRIAVVCVLLILIPLYYQFCGDGKLELTTEGKAIELLVDGKKVEPARTMGEHRVYLVAPGKHDVQVRDVEKGEVTAQHAIDLDSPSTHLVIPTTQTRCFAHVNLTKRMERRANGDGDWPPEVARRFGPSPFELPQWTSLSPEELPRRVEAMSMVFLLLPIDCTSPDPSGEEILRRGKGRIP